MSYTTCYMLQNLPNVMTDKKEKIKEIKEENDKATMETLGVDYKKVSSQKHQCEKK